MKTLTGSAIVALALAALVMGVPEGRHDARAAGSTVAVANFSFMDGTSGTSTTTINVGDTVTWTWSSGTHSATSDSVPAGASAFDSGILSTPSSFGPVTFTVAGTYTYHCTVHPGMTGTIVVQAAATATATPVTPTSTTVAATSTPVAATSTPASATSTPVAGATTPAASATSAAVASPSSGPAAVAAAPTTASGGAAGAAALPQSGSGVSDGGSSSRMWVMLALATAGAGLGIAVMVRAGRRRVR